MVENQEELKEPLRKLFFRVEPKRVASGSNGKVYPVTLIFPEEKNLNDQSFAEETEKNFKMDEIACDPEVY